LFHRIREQAIEAGIGAKAKAAARVIWMTLCRYSHFIALPYTYDSNKKSNAISSYLKANFAYRSQNTICARMPVSMAAPRSLRGGLMNCASAVKHSQDATE
jgi:hypothetical protein